MGAFLRLPTGDLNPEASLLQYVKSLDETKGKMLTDDDANLPFAEQCRIQESSDQRRSLNSI
jgi:hypothetical protein